MRAACARSRALDLTQTRPWDGGKDPDSVPGPFAGAVAAPTSFRACHHRFLSRLMDCTICAPETSRRDAVRATFSFISGSDQSRGPARAGA